MTCRERGERKEEEGEKEEGGEWEKSHGKEHGNARRMNKVF